MHILKKQGPQGHFHSCNHQKWLLYQIQGDKTINNVQIDPQHGDMVGKPNVR